MKTANNRCVALRGTVGCGVSCAVYKDRPAACRAFVPGGTLCLEARAAAGLEATGG